MDQDFGWGMDTSGLHPYTSADLGKASICGRLDEATKSTQNRVKGIKIQGFKCVFIISLKYHLTLIDSVLDAEVTLRPRSSVVGGAYVRQMGGYSQNECGRSISATGNLDRIYLSAYHIDTIGSLHCDSTNTRLHDIETKTHIWQLYTPYRYSIMLS
jgi:hypothetical protein